jgi:hypothetical protein
MQSLVNYIESQDGPNKGDILEFWFGELCVEFYIEESSEDSITLQENEHLSILTENGIVLETLEEAVHQGRAVPLNKPMRGDVKKSKVYVKGPSGRVVKVNFGDKNMKIKKNIPARRRSFRARHKCETPGPKWKARYWSCKAW